MPESPPRRLLVLELNEAPLGVLEERAREAPGGALARVLREGRAWATVTRDGGHLSPWTTWATVHRGVGAEVHGVRDQGQDLGSLDRSHPALWRLALEAGRTVGIGGCLGSAPLPADAQRFAFHLPDTFAEDARAHPAHLARFQELNLALVDASSRNVGTGLPWGPALRALPAAPRLGWGPRVLGAVVRQLAAERVQPWRRIRRRSLQAVLGFAAFRAEVRRTRPDYAAFFTNHLASSLHRYWPARWPEDYAALDLGDAWRRRYRHEIDVALEVADRQLAALLAEAGRTPGTVVLVVSSMGQAALDEGDVRLRQLHLVDPARLFRALGLKDSAWEPRRAMAPRFVFRIAEPARETLRRALHRMRIQGEALDWEEHEGGVFRLLLGHRNLTDDDTRIELGDRQLGLREAGMQNLEVEDRSGAYAYHVPEGALLAWGPGTEAARWEGGDEPGDIRALAPAMLELLGVPAPGWMTLRGLEL